MASFRSFCSTSHDAGRAATGPVPFRPGRATALVILALVSLHLVAPGTAGAQLTVFGKNKVQYNDFEWHVLRAGRFDVYFYPEEEELGRRAAAWSEDSYGQLSAFFGHEVEDRIPLIIYSSHQAFVQTNVTPFFLPEGVAGLTEFMKGRVLMPFNGSYPQFRATLHHELVHVFQLSLTTAVYKKHLRHQLAAVPLWFSEGMADYLAEPWEPSGEMIMADMAIEGRLPAIDQLWRYNGTFTLYKLGQRLVGFLVETYGREVINRVYENLWVDPDFSRVLRHVTGDDLETISDRWHAHERRAYYPRVVDGEPIPLAARALTTRGANFKPIEIPEGIVGKGRRFVFLSPRTGYTNIYCASLDGKEVDVVTVVHGEREAQFESLHPFLSKVDVSGEGRLVFVSKWHDRDALLVLDLRSRELIGRYRFDRVVSISSPAWSPDGGLIAFQGQTDDARSDLYLFDPVSERIDRLTHDLYQDLDPDFSPDGRTIVFASDRTEYGQDGSTNLFLMDVETRTIRYLTRGPWHDTAPRFAPDSEKIYFSSSRDGTPNLYEVDVQGSGRRLTRFLTGALDPSPTLDGQSLLFTGFARGRFDVYSLKIPPPDPEDAEGTFVLRAIPGEPGWGKESLGTESGSTEVARYRRRFSLDFAAGGVAFDPSQSDAAGGQLAFTDMLGDEIIFAQVGNTAERGVDILERMNLGLSYLNLRRRINYGIGVFHLAGDYRDERDLPFFERRAGASLIASYPFSKFERVETAIGMAYSDKRNESTGIDRRAYLVTNFVSWVHDNALWLSTGPIDGSRIKGTLGLTLDLPRSQVENFQLIGDYRRYVRTGLRSAWASRVQGRLSVGSDPRFYTLGGTHTLRGYPREDLFGTRAILVNNEYRFPLLNGFVIGFPFGAVEFPGVEGALFVDAGWLWNENEDVPWPPLGSFGTSLRMGFGGFLVFRLDLARRTDFTSIEKSTQTEFFIGWNY